MWNKHTMRGASSILKSKTLTEIEEKQGEKLTVNNIQMIEGATTIEHKESQLMSQVNQVLNMMGMTEMAEITTAMLSLTVATVLQVKIVSPTMEIEM